jgi:hypothetical protein
LTSKGKGEGEGKSSGQEEKRHDDSDGDDDDDNDDQNRKDLPKNSKGKEAGKAPWLWEKNLRRTPGTECQQIICSNFLKMSNIEDIPNF